MSRTLRQLKTGTRIGDDAQANAATFAKQAASSPFWQGNYVTGVSLSGGVLKAVPHGLARVYLGWILVRVQAPSGYPVLVEQPRASLTSASSPSISVPIIASATCVADFWFF